MLVIDWSRNPTEIIVRGFGEKKGETVRLQVKMSSKTYTVTESSLVNDILPNPAAPSERAYSSIYWSNETGFRRWPLFSENGGYMKPSGYKVTGVAYPNPIKKETS